MYCIFRGTNSGVHAGELLERTGQEVTIGNARRLWYWKSNGGVAFSGLSQLGLKEGKIDTVVPKMLVLDVIEVIPCTPIAEKSIVNYV